MKSTHPVDKLFARKLASLEDIPSQSAWLTLEMGLQQKQRKKSILWSPYAAAAAVVLIVASIIGVSEQTEKPAIPVAQNPVMPAQAQKAVKMPQPQKQPAPHIAVARQPAQKQTVATPRKTLPAVKQKPAVKARKPARRSGPVYVPEKSKEAEIIAPQLPTENTIATLKTVPVAAPSLPATIVVTVALEPEPEEPENEAGQIAGKQTRAAKLLGKLKQLKRGEFDELGIRKETLVAFVREKTQHSKPDSHQE